MRASLVRSAAVVSSFALSAGALAQTAVQWRVEDGGNGHWYRRLGELHDWPTARARCEQLGGHLATLVTSAEWSWAINATGITEGYVGAFQDHALPSYSEPNGGWRWVTGETFNFASSYMMTFDDCPGAAPPSCTCGAGAQDALFIMGCCSHMLNDGQDGTAGDCDMGVNVPYPPVDCLIEWSADCNNDGIVDYGQILSGRFADIDLNNVPDCCEQSIDCPPEPSEWPAAQGGNGHWYSTIGSKLSWSDAKAYCESRGGHLVTLTSAPEWSWVSQRFPERWVGANQSASNPGYSEPYGGWRWVTGEPWAFDSSYMMPFDDCPGLVMPGCTCGTGAQDALFIMGCCNHMLNDNQDGSEGDCLFNKQMPYLRVDGVIEWSADCNGDGIVDLGQIRAGQLADANHNNIPDCCEAGTCLPCQADVDQSGAVNGVDLAAVLNNWGTSGGKQPRSDINHDGIVNGADLSEVLNAWGPCH